MTHTVYILIQLIIGKIMFMHFYKRQDSYGEVVNYSYHQFKLDEKIWPSIDHYLQCKNFLGDQYLARLRQKHYPIPTKAMDSSDFHRHFNKTKLYTASYQKFVRYINLDTLLLSDTNQKNMYCSN